MISFLVLCVLLNTFLCVEKNEYEILLKKNGKFDLSEEEKKNSIIMNVAGRQFLCSMESLLNANEEIDYEEDVLHLTAQEEIELNQEIANAIEKNVNGKCFQLFTRGWWNYQVCFKKKNGILVQFHNDQKNPSQNAQIILGQMHNPLDKLEKYVNNDNLEESYMELDLPEGSICDLTKQPRQSKVRIYCPSAALQVNPGGQGTPPVMFMHIEETKSCNYLSKVYITELCSYPGFGVPVVRKKESNKVRCQPFMDGEELEEEEKIDSEFDLEKIMEEVEVSASGNVFPKKFIVQ